MVGNDPGQGGTECETCAAGWVYQIQVKGHLNSDWSGWFEGLTITHQEDGTTLLTGAVVDQPALHGLLIRIRDLGLPLISINSLGGGSPGSSRPSPREPAQQSEGGSQLAQKRKGE